jgi:hypothetical protein
MTPEEKARRNIDQQLAQCGWVNPSRAEKRLGRAEPIGRRASKRAN